VSYTAIAVLGVLGAVAADLWLLRTRLLRHRDFWTAYAIMVFFQLITNGVLTGRQVVNYADDTIIGTGNDVAAPQMFSPGRLFYAPVEDLLFGFSMILLTLSVWVWLGRRGLQRIPFSGPPRWRRRDVLGE
jgi:lycopene cyclase domain-containing protein